MDENGGYYAIKGFAYQLDKAIIEIFSAISEVEPVAVENIQDINSESVVVQIKYKETQEFSWSKVKNPIIQLIEEYLEQPEKKYVLYCHFKDKQESIKSLTEEELEIILMPISARETKKQKKTYINPINSKIEKLNSVDLSGFLKSFVIQFSSNHEDQFEQALSRIKAAFCVSDEDIAIIYYSAIVEFIKSKIIKTIIPSERVVTRKDLNLFLNNGKNKFFTASFLEYKGEDKYFSIIKRDLIKPIKSDINAVFIGQVRKDNNLPIEELVVRITQRWMEKANTSINPMLFILPSENCRSTKVKFIDCGIVYNDGFEDLKFSTDLLNRPPIKTAKLISSRPSDSLDKIAFSAKIISHSTFFDSKKHIKFNSLYVFDAQNVTDVETCLVQQIDKLSTSRILQLF